ncbi:MAG TPA: hypothetical protein VFZ70_00755 [Euzebyales bacterium]
MFFILGIRSRTTTVARGRFRCPNESTERRFDHLRARRWFTVFFLPVIPLGTHGEWVRCSGCGARYGPDVVVRHRAAGRAARG